mmetsp:Transcript_131897/g.422317  ORF Transcript_131897/g.422317 Transcript_131897/m.422317 type:complete len:310 (-) Transcript_131897:3590-4519(-)
MAERPFATSLCTTGNLARRFRWKQQTRRPEISCPTSRAGEDPARLQIASGCQDLAANYAERSRVRWRGGFPHLRHFAHNPQNLREGKGGTRCRLDAPDLHCPHSSSALSCATQVRGEDIGDDTESSGDGCRIFFREVLRETSRGGDAIDPTINDADVLLLELAHGDHDHVQVGRRRGLERPCDQLAVQVLAAAAQVVAVGQADEPPRGIRLREAGLPKLLEALQNGVEEGRSTEHLRLQTRDLRVDVRAADALSGGRDDGVHLCAEANDADKVLAADLVTQDAPNASDTSLEPVQIGAGVLGEHREAPI